MRRPPDPTPTYASIWDFRVRPAEDARFREVHGPAGSWVALFRRASGYRSTRLYRDHDDRHHYVTVDVWESRAAYDAFQRDFAAEYARLDAECEGLTLSEARIGHFEVEPG